MRLVDVENLRDRICRMNGNSTAEEFYRAKVLAVLDTEPQVNVWHTTKTDPPEYADVYLTLYDHGDYSYDRLTILFKDGKWYDAMGEVRAPDYWHELPMPEDLGNQMIDSEYMTHVKRRTLGVITELREYARKQRETNEIDRR